MYGSRFRYLTDLTDSGCYRYSLSTVMDTCFKWMHLILNFYWLRNKYTYFRFHTWKVLNKIKFQRKKYHDYGVMPPGDAWSPAGVGRVVTLTYIMSNLLRVTYVFCYWECMTCEIWIETVGCYYGLYNGWSLRNTTPLLHLNFSFILHSTVW